MLVYRQRKIDKTNI